MKGIMDLPGEKCDNSNKKDYAAACADTGILKCEDSNLQAVAEGETILHIETWNGVKKDVSVKIDMIPVEDGTFVINGTGEVTIICKAWGGVEKSVSLQVVDKSQGYLTGLLVVGAVGGGSLLVVRKRRKKRRG